MDRLNDVREACSVAGRDAASLSLTVCVTLAFPDLASELPTDALTGTEEEIAAALEGYADLGVSELIFDVNPYTPEAIGRLAQAVNLHRARTHRA